MRAFALRICSSAAAVFFSPFLSRGDATSLVLVEVKPISGTDVKAEKR